MPDGSRPPPPYRVVFVGEGPGKSENMTGQPFEGAAGIRLDRIVAKSVPPHVTVGYTNLVCCIPWADATRSAVTEPGVDHVEACMPRLQEFMRLANPDLIVCLGVPSHDWHDPKVKKRVNYHRPTYWWYDGCRVPSGNENGPPIRMIDVPHPAWILRLNVAQQSITEHRCVVRIHTAVADLLGATSELGQRGADDHEPAADGV